MEKDKNILTDTGKKNLTSAEAEKSKIHIIVEIIEYMPNAVVSKTIIKKTSGNVTVTSFAADEELAEKKSPYDTFIQIIDGAAEIIISEKKYQLKTGNGIVVPSNAPYCINAHEKFKMISTVIKGIDNDPLPGWTNLSSSNSNSKNFINYCTRLSNVHPAERNFQRGAPMQSAFKNL